jgi:hypothetical protein
LPPTLKTYYQVHGTPSELRKYISCYYRKIGNKNSNTSNNKHIKNKPDHFREKIKLVEGRHIYSSKLCG